MVKSTIDRIAGIVKEMTALTQDPRSRRHNVIPVHENRTFQPYFIRRT